MPNNEDEFIIIVQLSKNGKRYVGRASVDLNRIRGPHTLQAETHLAADRAVALALREIDHDPNE